MKFSSSAIIISSLIAVASANGHNHVARQAAASGSPAASSAPPASATPTPTPTPSQAPAPDAAAASSGTPPPPASSGAPVSGSVSGSSTANITLSTVPFSLLATNPTAVPLSSIVSGASSPATLPLTTTVTAGSVPTGVTGAPPLPNAGLLSPSNYPPLDKPPPTDSALVQQWIQEVQNSGITIPGFSPNSPGGCPNNTQAVADTTRCWWTCGGCTRQSDVTTCPDKLTWGLTYDDGPAFYTENLLEYLNQQNLKSTFFVVGSRVISFPFTLQEEYMAGHQIAVHTWSHTALTTQTNEEIIAELGWSKKVIKDVLGVTPNMMRPPYGDIDDRVRAICAAMGLTPVIWTRLSPTSTFDTNDFNIAGGTVAVSQVLQNWEFILGNATEIDTGFIVLEHDLFPQSVEVATGYILPDAIAHKFDIKPVVSCLNKPMSDAYIETNDNKTNPPAASGIAVTLSPGAPGSAQATAAAGSKSKSAASVPDSATVFTALGGALAAVGALLF